MKLEAPKFIREKLAPYIPSRHLRSSSSSLLVVPRFRKTRVGAAVLCFGARSLERPSLGTPVRTQFLVFQETVEGTVV